MMIHLGDKRRQSAVPQSKSMMMCSSDLSEASPLTISSSASLRRSRLSASMRESTLSSSLMRSSALSSSWRESKLSASMRSGGIVGTIISCNTDESHHQWKVAALLGAEFDELDCSIDPNVKIRGEGVNREDLVNKPTLEELKEIKLRLAELQTEVMVESNRRKQEQEAVAALERRNAILLEENTSLKRKTSALEAKVRCLHQGSEEMVSRIVLLICEIDRLRGDKPSSIQTDSVISAELKDKIQEVMIALKAVSEDDMDLPCTISPASHNQMADAISKAYTPIRTSGNDTRYCSRHSEETIKIGTFQKMIRRSSAPDTSSTQVNNEKSNELPSGTWLMQRRTSLPDNLSSSFRGMFRAFNKSRANPCQEKQEVSHQPTPRRPPSTRRQGRTYAFQDPFQNDSPPPVSQVGTTASNPNFRFQKRNTYDNNRVHLKDQNTVFFPFDSFTAEEADKLRVSEKTAELTLSLTDTVDRRGSFGTFDGEYDIVYDLGFQAASAVESRKYSAKQVNRE